MGMYNSLIANAKSIVVDPTSSAPLATLNKIRAYRDQKGDPALPSGFAGANEVQVIPEVVADAGTYTITLRIDGLNPFTTAALDFDDVAATIEAAIDAAAATAAVPGFTAGDIAVTGGPINAADITLTYDGVSVAGANHGLATVTSSLTASAAPVAAPTATVTTNGQRDRAVYAVLDDLRVIVMETPPPVGTPATIVAGSNLLGVAPWFVQELAKELRFQESSEAVEAAVLAILPQT